MNTSQMRTTDTRPECVGSIWVQISLRDYHDLTIRSDVLLLAVQLSSKLEDMPEAVWPRSGNPLDDLLEEILSELARAVAPYRVAQRSSSRTSLWGPLQLFPRDSKAQSAPWTLDITLRSIPKVSRLHTGSEVIGG